MYEMSYYKTSDPTETYDLNTTETSIVIEALSMNSDYLFQIKAYTSQGAGPWSARLPFRTFGQLPPPPTNIHLRRVSPTAIEVRWDPPTLTTNIAGYRVYYNMFAVPDMDEWQSVELDTTRLMEINGLEPHSVYAVRVRSKSKDGRYGNFSEIKVSTNSNQYEPEMVQDCMALTQNPRSVMLEWKPPRQPGVNRYRIEYEGMKRYKDQYGLDQLHLDKSKAKYVPSIERQLYIDELVPNTVYSFSISAKYPDGWGPKCSFQMETSVDAPPPILRPEFRKTISDNVISLKLKGASGMHGKINHYFIVVLTEDKAQATSPNNFELEKMLRGQQSNKAWVAARFHKELPTEFRLGDNSRPGTGDYHNRPLQKDQVYRVFIRAYTTDNKYTSSEYSEPLSTDGSYQSTLPSSSGPGDGAELLWIVVPVCVAIILLLIIVFIIILMRYRRRTRYKEKPPEPSKMLLSGTSEPAPHPTDPVEMRRIKYQTPAMMNHPPIPVTELENHIENLKASDGQKFSAEYESIEPGQQFTWDHSNMEANKSKNRYANVIAYDHSRVVLPIMDGELGSDYINANFMDGYRKHNAYIATQGPLPETFSDFWRMIWEQRSVTIVMMTKLEERTRIKCDQYWPNRGMETYGCMHVSLVDVAELATYTVRTFHLTRTCHAEKREVKQFQFTAWPDHGVPDHPTPLLLFMRRVKAMTPTDSGPIVCHCSAGVGRTGAFIVIDSMLERIKHEKTVDIYGHVTCLRAQRNYMVQTEDQYVFIHDALLEAVQSGNTEIPARNLYAHIQKLTQPEPGDTATGMEHEFKRLSNLRANPSKFVSANLPVNKFKNRLVNILPYESTRVCLQPIRGVDGSDYINASFIDGYRYRKAYIGTQGPLQETTEDYWRMLWEHNSTIIVMLTKTREMGRDKCHQYWPSERSARYQYFVVDPMAEYNMPQYILREFKVTDARDGQSRTIRQFQFTDWPEQGVPKSGEGFIDFIGQVHKTKEQFGQDGPITVHCSAGVGRTGVFITLSIVLERMRYEGVVDMFQTCKMLRTQRPAMVQTEDQYGFCYRAALEYLGSFDHYAT